MPKVFRKLCLDVFKLDEATIERLLDAEDDADLQLSDESPQPPGWSPSRNPIDNGSNT